jgi:hypothetical protein
MVLVKICICSDAAARYITDTENAARWHDIEERDKHVHRMVLEAEQVLREQRASVRTLEALPATPLRPEAVAHVAQQLQIPVAAVATADKRVRKALSPPAVPPTRRSGKFDDRGEPLTDEFRKHVENVQHLVKTARNLCRSAAHALDALAVTGAGSSAQGMSEVLRTTAACLSVPQALCSQCLGLREQCLACDGKGWE